MKINWKVRVKNPYFWIGLVGVIMAAMGVSPEMFTSWSAVGNQLLEFVSNPFMIGSVIVAVIGVLVDPTTTGLSDSTRALSYDEPNAE
jgi:phi LC3 family holin